MASFALLHREHERLTTSENKAIGENAINGMVYCTVVITSCVVVTLF